MEDKASKRALEAYPSTPNWDERITRMYRGGFIKGYHQAKKDMELTWEDMMLIHRCIKDAMNYHLYKMMEGVEGQKVVYQEVLKRFKDLKERKEE